MTRPRAADDFAVIRAQIGELRRERLTSMRAADDFPAIRARMQELRRELVQASARPATPPLPLLPDHAAHGRLGDTGRHRLLRAIRQKFLSLDEGGPAFGGNTTSGRSSFYVIIRFIASGCHVQKSRFPTPAAQSFRPGASIRRTQPADRHEARAVT